MKNEIQERLAAAEQELQRAKALKKKNDQFRRLSAPKKRVAIAQDVLAQLASGRYIAASTYFNQKGTLYKDQDDPGAVQLCDVRDQIKCEVCGIGSLMVSACGFVNKLTLEEAANADNVDIHDYLEEWFDSDQLHMIEMWFEAHRGQNATWAAEHHVDEPPRDHPLIKGARSAHVRLTRIMENIISNNGKFNPTKGAHSGPIPKKEDDDDQD